MAAACSSGGGQTASPTAAATAGPSTSGACPTAPALVGDPAGWSPPTTAPVVVPLIIAGAGELACGPNRVLFTILDKDGRPIGAPDRTAKIAIFDLGRDATKPIATLDGTFIWAIENERGIYVANTTFPEAGLYGAEFTTAVGTATPVVVRLTFDVQPSSAVIKVGQKAPSSRTPTVADVGGDPTRISTDPTPDPAFYQTSVDQAIAAHKPFVLIFATPKFCTSAQCGPTLDRIKPYVTKYPTVTFINVEPYKLKLVDGVLQADVDANNRLQNVAATDEWHLFSEPNVYVVDRNGIVTANFELIFSDAELTTALDGIK
ncbi:MAG: hypothetical protein HYX55_07365 [Chloroflexi bacterium]|nr:hypothetical protein [Chloroflexota bacterium]